MHSTLNNHTIITVDTLYIQKKIAAAYIIHSNQQVAIIDTGTQHSIKLIQTALFNLELSWEHVRYIILTHIHLDHAGGASALMHLCPNAKLVCHPRGSRHMIEPQALKESAKKVYGDEKFKQTYGDILPIEAHRVMEVNDNDFLELGDRRLHFIDTPGHAYHHHCILDEQTNSVFTGDTLGVSYPTLAGDKPFLFPSTTPTQFNPDVLHQSVEKVMSLQPTQLYPTHFGPISPNAYMIAGLHEQIDDFVMLTQQTQQSDETDKETALKDKLLDYLCQRCLNNGYQGDLATIRQALAMDSMLNAQGLLYWANKQSLP